MRILKCIAFCICLMGALQATAGDKLSFLKKQFTTQNGYKLNYRVLLPADYCPEQKYPVILFLHGAGERGNDNEKQLVHGWDLFTNLQNRADYPAIVLAPQCPEQPDVPTKNYWVAIKRPVTPQERMFRTFPANAPITEPLAAVKELLDSYIAKGVVDTKRIYVTGLSMGGMGTFDLVCRYPNLFAAAVPICGAVNTDRLARYKGKPPFRLFHGADDDVVLPKFSQEAYKTLKSIGAEVQYTEYPGVNHGSWVPAFKEPDFLSWMFKQVKK